MSFDGMEISLRVQKQIYHPALLKKTVCIFFYLIILLDFILLTMHPFSYEGL